LHPITLFKKTPIDNNGFRREITAAVVFKFLLLAGLWWLFFKGHKQPVDGDIIAAKLFGDNPTAIQNTKKARRNPK
jgi:hypothetical protein